MHYPFEVYAYSASHPPFFFVAYPARLRLDHMNAQFWEENAPECVSRVTFMPHDFFSPQIHEKIFFMRFIIHDWVDEDCLRLLKPIRDVIPTEAEGGRLYIADSVLDEKSERLKYMLDLQMLTFTGAMERTEVEFDSLLRRAGFRILKIHKNRGFCALIEAVAA